ncbi:putative ubiquitin-conjugating enzyme E2 23 [Panicum miliaceum]|uniref:Ubiquitin-conjugating enzyme E2 23 n=1 Tax=Panicum miliaceum TaxID=4540 RepID=A0A3L6SKM9_PANMI|nr:putative ubiquitin-conjugating enzyme E2 23 [Panicum miliaceum]
MALKKLLQLFCVKEGRFSVLNFISTLPLRLWDPTYSGDWTEHGTGSNDYMSFNQFDVVQDFSDHHYAKTSPGKATKDWAKAIQSEWNLLQKNLPESIYVRVYEDRIDLLRAAIVGPAGTPYHDGLFFFDVRFPSEYPKSPPHFETLVAGHFHEREHAFLDACSAYMSGTVVGSSAGSSARYACDKCFADFKKSLTLYTEHLRTEFAANRSRLLELERQASAVGEIVPSS